MEQFNNTFLIEFSDLFSCTENQITFQQLPDILSFEETYPDFLNICDNVQTKENAKALDSPISFEALTESPALDYNMLLSSPSMITMGEERRDFFEEAFEYNRPKKPFTIIRQSKKITKELPQKKQNQKFRSRGNRWTEEEDLQIRELVEKYGPQWTKIGCMIGNKTGKQVRDRYMNASRSDIKVQEWTEEEDALFISLLKEFGNKWSQIAARMPGRTENQVKNKFYCVKKYNGNVTHRRSALSQAIEAFESKNSDCSKSTVKNESEIFEDIDKYFEFN